jgi:prepilin-type N-terminal cleavage/methylation domain-containing protein
MSRRSQFTLIELLVTITVIAVLSGLTIAGVRFAFQRSEEAAIKARIKTMEMALEEYKRDWGYYPVRDVAGNVLNFTMQSPDGRAYLEHGTTPYRQSKNGPEMLYRHPGEKNTEKYDLWAPGINEVDENGGGDDITNWEQE